MEILAFLSMDASGRHPIEDAGCFGLLLCCHCFSLSLALPFGEVFDSDGGAMAAGALVGLSGYNFFGKLDFNKFSSDCALMSSLSSSKCSCNLFQR